jgi:hypothetical protein
MSIDALNEAVASAGGTWAKLKAEGDVIEGTIVEFEKRERRTPQGEIVLSKKTNKPRIEWVFTLQTDERDGDDDDGIRKLSCNESMQRAISEAIRDAGKPAEVSGTLKVGFLGREDEYSQAEYRAKYTAPVKSVDIDTSDF